MKKLFFAVFFCSLMPSAFAVYSVRVVNTSSYVFDLYITGDVTIEHILAPNEIREIVLKDTGAHSVYAVWLTNVGDYINEGSGSTFYPSPGYAVDYWMTINTSGDFYTVATSSRPVPIAVDWAIAWQVMAIGVGCMVVPATITMAMRAVRRGLTHTVSPS